MKAPELATHELSVRYGERLALDAVSLQLTSGVTALIGANGAGKSTLLRILATAERPSSGTYTFDGVDVDLSSRAVQAMRRALGWLPQTFGYEPRSRVRDFLTYMAWLRGVPARSRLDRVRDALQFVGLSERSEDRIRALSGGMVRRLGIAQAVVAQPAVLLLDEPASGLDPLQREDMYRLITELKSDRTIVVSTHLIEDIPAVADRVVILRTGRVAWSGAVSELAHEAGPLPLSRYVSSLLRDES